jgi:Fic family protein
MLSPKPPGLAPGYPLEKANKRNEIPEWLAWFAAVAIEAQHRTLAQVEFLIDKTRLLDSLRGRMNDRQSKVVLRMLQEGPEGFAGGMDAKKYHHIAGSSPATTTRDLAGLVELGAFTRSGELKHTRYALNLPLRPTPKIRIDAHGDVIGKHQGDRNSPN